MKPELGILADDLAGATDTGLQFAKGGRRTSVSLNWPASPACDVLVFDTDSRGRSFIDARKRIVAATHALRVAGARRFYKKIDSTGRGNLGAEIEGMLEQSGAGLALICPAYPELGRTVRDGMIYVNDVPLAETEFADDPIWPATTSSIEEMLRRQTTLPIDHLNLVDVQAGTSRIQTRLTEKLRAGWRLIIADAETRVDLDNLANVVSQAEQLVLQVGSAGFAECLVGSLARPDRASRTVSLISGPILVVAGTMNRIGANQVSRLVARGASLVTLSPEQALDNPERAAGEIVQDLSRHLRTSSCVVLSLGAAPTRAAALRQAAAARGLSLSGAAEHLTQSLGLTVERAINTAAPAALILTGGDTARGVCGALGVQTMDVYSEAAPGVPICVLRGGRWDGLPVLTKAGGFGDTDTLARVVTELEGMRA